MVSCSVLLQGGRGAADKCHWRVWVVLTVFRPHWVCPPLMGVCSPHLHCSGSRLLYMDQALHCMQFQFSGSPQKHGLGWACVLCLPQPEQLRQPGASWAHSPQVRCAFFPPWSQPQFPRTSWVREPCVCSRELASSRNPPGRCRPSRISGSLWLETVGLFAVW